MCGSIFAQVPLYDLIESSHWSDFNDGPFETNTFFGAIITIDGEIVSYEYSNWEYLELAAFDDNEVCRGHDGLWDDGEQYPMALFSVFHMDSETGLSISFKLYDHLNRIEYGYGTLNIPCITGEENFDVYDWDEETTPVISFTTPTSDCYEKDFLGYENEDGIDHWYLIASPVGTIDGYSTGILDSGPYDLYSFDQSESEGLEWINLTNGDPMLELTKGYLYATQNDSHLQFCKDAAWGDAPTEESMLLELDYDSEAELAGWNLMGNPFPTTAYVDRDFYLLDPETNKLLPAEHPEDGIPAMEGFFVKAEEEGETLVISTEFYGKKNAGLALNLSNGRNVIDRAIVRFGEGRQLPKFQFNRNSTKVYIPQDNKDYAVVYGESMGEMPVNFKAENNGRYSFCFNSQDVNFTYLHLVDNLTGDNIDLLENPSYSFDARTTDYASRFKLVYATSNTANSNDFGFISNDHLMILGLEGNATLKVMDITGRTLSTENFSGSYDKALNLSAGVYMLQLIQGSNVKTQKIVVR